MHNRYIKHLLGQHGSRWRVGECLLQTYLFVDTLEPPQAAVAPVGIFQGEPKANTARRVSVKEAAVLMGGLATQSRSTSTHNLPYALCHMLSAISSLPKSLTHVCM
jgi:hypothetical protein